MIWGLLLLPGLVSGPPAFVDVAMKKIRRLLKLIVVWIKNAESIREGLTGEEEKSSGWA